MYHKNYKLLFSVLPNVSIDQEKRIELWRYIYFKKQCLFFLIGRVHAFDLFIPTIEQIDSSMAIHAPRHQLTVPLQAARNLLLLVPQSLEGVPLRRLPLLRMANNLLPRMRAPRAAGRMRGLRFPGLLRKASLRRLKTAFPRSGASKGYDCPFVYPRDATLRLRARRSKTPTIRRVKIVISETT